ncbi:MAG TPA: dihydrofolate reductase family protein [Solirubrobacteraceae bacterium]|nr:dihydrofolate reductase family protein [Solirubrobacteraceae bacterium]
MGTAAQPDPQPSAQASPALAPLLPPGPAAGAEQVVEDWGLWRRNDSHSERPRVMLNMVSTVDGRASLDGRSAPLSSSADRALFHALRTPVDAVLVGAGTVRTERYGRIVRDNASCQARLARGLPAQPLACIVSGRVALGADIPLLADPDARVAIVTGSSNRLPEGARAQLEYVRARRDGGLLDLPAALAQLRERFDVRTLLCEGGPHLAGELFAGGLVDELFLSISPTLAGDPQGDTRALRILAGTQLRPRVDLQLLGALHSGSHLFLRYGVAR